jgi:cell division transport system permease protein
MARPFVAREEPDVPSGTITWFFREALRRIWVSKRTSFVAITMISISILIVGAFLLLADALGRAAEQWQGKSRVIIYMDPHITPPQAQAVDRFLATNPELERRKLVSREEALKRFKTWFANIADVVGELDENPFPSSYEVEVDPRLAQSGAFHQHITALRAMPGVDQVQYDWEWIERLRRLVGIINIVGLVAGGVLAVAAAFTIANVIRLTMILYREEVEIMRLVGATERIIRGPFLVEGFLQGTLGGLLAIGLLYAVFMTSRRFMAPSILWSFLFTGFLPWQKLLALVGGGMLAGFLGSWMSVRHRID